MGLVTSGALSLSLLIGYTCFIGVLFAILKVVESSNLFSSAHHNQWNSVLQSIVSHLHVVFDTSEPIITTKVVSEAENSTRAEPDIIG